MAKEYIERKPILKFIEDGLNNPDKAKSFGHDAIEIMAEVQYAPAADVVEVVRCKECKYRGIGWSNGKPCCGNLHAGMTASVELKDDDFCSYGERRDN